MAFQDPGDYILALITPPGGVALELYQVVLQGDNVPPSAPYVTGHTETQAHELADKLIARLKLQNATSQLLFVGYVLICQPLSARHASIH